MQLAGAIVGDVLGVASQLYAGRELRSHPTVKPVALVTEIRADGSFAIDEPLGPF